MAERRCDHCRCLKAWQQLTNIGVVLIRVTGKVNSDVFQAVNPTTSLSPAGLSAGVLSGPREQRLTDGADGHRAVRVQSLAPRDQPLTLGTHASHSHLAHTPTFADRTPDRSFHIRSSLRQMKAQPSGLLGGTNFAFPSNIKVLPCHAMPCHAVPCHAMPLLQLVLFHLPAKHRPARPCLASVGGFRLQGKGHGEATVKHDDFWDKKKALVHLGVHRMLPGHAITPTWPPSRAQAECRLRHRTLRELACVRNTAA